MNIHNYMLCALLLGLAACSGKNSDQFTNRIASDTTALSSPELSLSEKPSASPTAAEQRRIGPAQPATADSWEEEEIPAKYLRAGIVDYAATLEGIPYKEMGKDEEGFDCSGFVSYVFKEFDIEVPSSSKYMINHGEEVPLEEALPGDIIIFTGTNPSLKEPGHVGIIVSQPGEPLSFIHSSSSKASACVKYSDFSPSYQSRYLSTRRVLED